MSEMYTNPVYDRSFADPFVLKYGGEYWAYCTGFWQDGRCFGILHSLDLVHWEEFGGAMAPLEHNPPLYWAPEVSYYNGHFYLYYSVGNEKLMEIRVAVADHPAGPFVDSGRRLTKEDFAIDAHVFQDEDGARYLFYATDYLEHTHLGTGTAVDRLLDPFTLAGNSRPVVRARYDWQVYDPQRAEKGGVRWHTVEGPFVLKHKGLYYEMFSGGNWQNISYGVSYATSPSLANPDEWQQAADGQQVLPILRTIPGKVIGPGHNSVVRGPDNRQLYCVYHRWALDGSARVLSIDPLDWAGERMLMLGPSVGPVPAPIAPTITGFEASAGWRYAGGQWAVNNSELVQASSSERTEARLEIDVPYFLAEICWRALAEEGELSISFSTQNDEQLNLVLQPGEKSLIIAASQGDMIIKSMLPSEFNFEAYHLLRLEVAGSQVSFKMDEGLSSVFTMPDQVKALSLITQNCRAAFAGFSLTVGWEDEFSQDYEPKVYGWESLAETSNWQVQAKELQGRANNSEPQIVTKGPLLEAYEVVINARLVELSVPEGSYGFYPAWYSESERGPLFKLERSSEGWLLSFEEGVAAEQSFKLASDFDPFVYQQFRFRKQASRLTLSWENQELGEVAIADKVSRVGLLVAASSAAFDLVRVTKISR